MLIYAITSPLVSKKGVFNLKLVMLVFANRIGANKATKSHLTLYQGNGNIIAVLYYKGIVDNMRTKGIFSECRQYI